MHDGGNLTQRILFELTRGMYASRTAKEPPPTGPERLLIVRVDERVGNLTTLQSLLDALKVAFPGIQLGLLCSVLISTIGRTLQGWDHLHLLDKRWFFRRPWAWHEAIQQVREQRYQVAIDASAWPVFSYTHAALTYFSGAPQRIGYRRSGNSGFHTVLVDPGPAAEYELKQRMRLLTPLGVKMEPPRLRTTLGHEQRVHWEQWLRAQGSSARRIGIWAGSRKMERRWPVEFYVRLGQRLISPDGKGTRMVILWGPGEEHLRDELATGLPGVAIVPPPTDLVQLAGLIQTLDLVVTNDTGPMHMSVAAGIPTVALFASGVPTRWGHPYPFVRNLFVPGEAPSDVEQAVFACRELMHQFHVAAD